MSLAARDGALGVKPVLAHRLHLDDVLAAVTVDNLHSPVDTEEPVGLEIFSCDLPISLTELIWSAWSSRHSLVVNKLAGVWLWLNR